jgi:pectate lyase
MKKLFLAIILLSACSLMSAVNYCAPSSWGYAGSSVTGGGSATPTLVSSVSQLKSALGSKAKNKVVIITKSLTFSSMLTIQNAQNITILGLPGVRLTSAEQTASTSGILFVKSSSNVIIRNLIFEGPGAYDCDGNDNLCFEKVTNAWVDHCDFQDGCDGNFDNKSTTDNVTVSWCRFRYLKAPRAGGSGGADDHRFTNLLGASSSDKPSDGTYNFTWAYCWWDEGCKERMVRCRNAELHFLNCYWNSSVANYYVGPENAKVYFEGCTFAGKANTAKNIFKSYGGTNACRFVNCEGKLPSNSGTVSAPTYAYDQLSAATAKQYVTDATCGAGATLVVNTQGEIGSSCDGGQTPTVDPTPQDTTPVTPPTPSGDLTWNFSTSDFTALTGDIVATTTVNGLTIAASSDKKVTLAAAAKTVEGIAFTHVLKTGGTGSAAARSLSFAVTGPCTIEVYLISANATSERTLNIYAGSYGGTPLTTMTAAIAAAKQTYSYTGGATTIYLGSANSGINFYAINLITPSDPTDDPTGIQTPTATSSARKILRGGRLLILRDGKVYDINGCLIY